MEAYRAFLADRPNAVGGVRTDAVGNSSLGPRKDVLTVGTCATGTNIQTKVAKTLFPITEPM